MFISSITFRPLTKRFSGAFNVTYKCNEGKTNDIASLVSNLDKKNVCHKTVIIVQCIEIRKLELLLCWKMHTRNELNFGSESGSDRIGSDWYLRFW